MFLLFLNIYNTFWRILKFDALDFNCRNGRGEQDGFLLERADHRLYGVEYRVFGQNHLQDIGTRLTAHH